MCLGQPGDLIAAKTELKIAQRLRLDQQKLEDLERKIRNSVTNAVTITGNNSHANTNGHLLNGLPSISNRKQLNVANQTKFAILVGLSKVLNPIQSPHSTEHQPSTSIVKTEMPSPSHFNGNDTHIEVKKEKVDTDDNDGENDDESSLSRLIAYLIE